MMDTDFLTRASSRLKSIHLAMRGAILSHTKKHTQQSLAEVKRRTEADFIYDIDESCENILLEECEKWGKEDCFILISEGIEGDGMRVFPESASPGDAMFRLIVDPIDGTRGIMYDKRSAWILSAIAPNKGAGTSLADIQLAIQTEIPLSKQYLADMLFAILGRGAKGERMNILTGETFDYYPRPSHADTLKHGFAMLTKFFPGRKQITAALEEELLQKLGVLDGTESTYVFDDQYISTGGQYYELAVGHDRFSGDFRAHLMKAKDMSGIPPGMAAHPYDVCTELIAREAGVIITDLDGNRLNPPLDVKTNVSWIGYANTVLKNQIAPVLQELLYNYNILE